ncbi:glycosyltransferase family 32 protein [Apiospora rasikravindrae]|uniref:Glycosyltransferase family 32 protein n=1 Tax=Apiospora rasikravindrae TaxID=990691 RepID=A0ABR1TEZ4_9PEZI
MWTRHPILHGPAARGLLIACVLTFLFWQLHRLGVGDKLQLPSLIETHFASISTQTGDDNTSAAPDASNNDNNDGIAQETIPKQIWFKLGPKGLNDNTRKWTETCIQQNPEYEPRYLTDAEADALVNTRFVHRPDIVDTYNALTVPILKADMLRYLLLYAEGGVWFDTDASCEGIPIEEWGITTAGTSNTTTTPTEQLRENRARASLIVGWEFDVGLDYEFERQFVTWAVAAKRGSPRLLTVVDDIVAAIHETASQQNLTVSELSMRTVPDVVNFTGPIRFARSVLRSLGLDRGGGGYSKKARKYHGLLEPALVRDVLILPGYAFARSMNTYAARDKDRVGPALVVHHYAGSWKNEYGGEKVGRKR